MKKLNVLQSWRTIFILMICLEHMALNNILNIFAAGGEGVTFFIVLSGFLSSYVYYNRSINFSISDQKEFTISKIKKFYPLHVCALLLSLLLSILVVIKKCRYWYWKNSNINWKNNIECNIFTGVYTSQWCIYEWN